MKTALETLSKTELHTLADALILDPTQDMVEKAVLFMESESRGFWHNRARAMLSRRLKHCPLDIRQQERLLTCILKRFLAGNFTEQFRDQLRLARHICPSAVRQVARQGQLSTKPYVRRLADWILAHEPVKNLTAQ